MICCTYGPMCHLHFTVDLMDSDGKAPHAWSTSFQVRLLLVKYVTYLIPPIPQSKVAPQYLPQSLTSSPQTPTEIPIIPGPLQMNLTPVQ